MTITLGSVYTINSSSSCNSISIAELSATSFVTVWRRSGRFYAAASTISGTTITTGSAVTIGSPASSTAAAISVCALSSTLALVIWQDTTLTLSISGTTVTANATAALYTESYASGNRLHSVTALSSTAALAVYSLSVASKMYAVVLSVSGTTVTVNTRLELGTRPLYMSVDALSSTAAIFTHVSSGTCYAAVISISGTTPSLGSAATLESSISSVSYGEVVQHWGVAVDSTHAVAAWVNGTSVKAAAMSISGSTVTVGSVVTVVSGLTSAWGACACAPTSSRVIFGYSDVGTSPARQFLISYALSGTTLTSNSDTTSLADNSYEGAVSATGTGFVCGYNAAGAAINGVAEAGATALTFYTGTTGLTYRSDLPDGITDIARGGLLVRQSGAVIIGAANANDVMLAQATSTDAFASWTDITESYPADAPVTAIVEVKSGSSF